MLISTLLANNRSDHNNVLNVLAADFECSDLVTGPFQPRRMKRCHDGFCGIFNELVVALPVIILSVGGEAGLRGQGR